MTQNVTYFSNDVLLFIASSVGRWRITTLFFSCVWGHQAILF